jgi:hypothetical protein
MCGKITSLGLTGGISVADLKEPKQQSIFVGF